MGVDSNPRYVIHLQAQVEAERVDSTYDPVDGFRATIAVDLRTFDNRERKALLIPMHVSSSEMRGLKLSGPALAEMIDTRCSKVAHRHILDVLAGERLPAVAGGGKSPKVSHADRARVLAQTLASRRSELEASHGADWLRVMLESEFRAVYADGEAKGYRIGVEETTEHTTTGKWFAEELRPRLVGAMPEVGAELGAQRFRVEPEK